MTSRLPGAPATLVPEDQALVDTAHDIEAKLHPHSHDGLEARLHPAQEVGLKMLLAGEFRLREVGSGDVWDGVGRRVREGRVCGGLRGRGVAPEWGEHEARAGHRGCPWTFR